jgi:hypothetical protein
MSGRSNANPPEGPFWSGVRFVLNGQEHDLDPRTAISRITAAAPEPVQTHGVTVAGKTYPVKQAFELVTGLPRSAFTSHTALRHLKALGLDIGLHAGSSVALAAPLTPAETATPAWPWEGEVQAVFIELLHNNGWTVTSAADTATKARGVDVIASKDMRWLGAEVKGWPSDGYADPRRATESKPTLPTTQAGHWFSQALFKAVMLLDSHPGHESLMVLPDRPRYRSLATKTITGRQAAGIHVVLLSPDGSVFSESWTA